MDDLKPVRNMSGRLSLKDFPPLRYTVEELRIMQWVKPDAPLDIKKKILQPLFGLAFEICCNTHNSDCQDLHDQYKAILDNCLEQLVKIYIEEFKLVPQKET